MTDISLSNLHSDLSARILELIADHTAVVQFREVVDTALSSGKTYYGINTGFGSLATKRIAHNELEELQHNLLRSHAVGVGEPLSKELSKLMLQLKIHALGLGHSGISKETFLQLIALLENDLIPVIPKQGSVGASGDLAPLSHLALPLLGEGQVWDKEGKTPLDTATAFKKKKIKPIALQAKEGLALNNGTQFMLALAADVLHRAQYLLTCADIIAAMSIEAIRGSHSPFDKRVQGVRPHTGQTLVAENLRALFTGSKLHASHTDCGRVQDPYSFRCSAVVHGASRDALAHCGSVVETELNSVTDNPLVFENGDIVSAGNFHGQPLALACDYAALALSELGNISDRRTYFLLSGHDRLPLFLLQDTGTDSGFMIPQYTTAALVSENKVLAHPASVDSIPTSLGQEDHVSMGSIGAVKLQQIFSNVQRILSIELLCAAQALDFHKEAPGKGVACAHKHIRTQIAHRTEDKEFQIDFDLALKLLTDDSLLGVVKKEISTLQ